MVLGDILKILRDIVCGEPTGGVGFLVGKPHIYYTVKAPWLQVKLLRVLQFFPAAVLGDTVLSQVNEILGQILNQTSRGVEAFPAESKQFDPTYAGPGGTNIGIQDSRNVRRANRKAEAERVNIANTQNCVLFEAINVVIHLDG